MVSMLYNNFLYLILYKLFYLNKFWNRENMRIKDRNEHVHFYGGLEKENEVDGGKG